MLRDSPQPRLDTRAPAVLERYLERSCPEGRVPSHVRLEQRGEMWLKPGARAMPFTATQLIAVDRVAFSWRARFPFLGPVALTVLDGYADDDGALEVRLLGLPLQRRRDHGTVVGEALRYLAELAWVPHAFVHNRALDWRPLDERSVEVSTQAAGERLAVTLTFDAGADLVHAGSDARPRQVGKAWVPTPWGGSFAGHTSIGGVRIPTSAEAYWDMPEGRYVYWRGHVLNADLLYDAPTGA